MMNQRKQSFLRKWLNVSVAFLLLLPLRLLNLFLRDYSPSELRAKTYVGARYIWSFVILRESSLLLEMNRCINNIVPTTAMQRILWIPILRLNLTKKLLLILQKRSSKRLQMRSISGQKYSLLYRLFPFLLKSRSEKLWNKAIHEKRTDLFRFSDPFRVNFKY